MNADIAEHARIAYDAGVDPLDYAEHEITTLIRVHLAAAVRAASSWPGPHPDLSPAALSRRIIGSLMNAGWTAPTTTDPTEGL